MHHDHDCDHHPFDPFFLIAFTHAHVLAGLDEGVEVESHRVELYLTWTPLFAHPPIFPPRERLSPHLTSDRVLRMMSEDRPFVEAALALPDTSPDCKGFYANVRGYKKLLDGLRDMAPGLPADAFTSPRFGAESFSVAVADADREVFRKRLVSGINSHNSATHEAHEHLARTWGDHGELFELPTGWRFQDNMIQGAIGEPGDNLFAVITYDGDNLPNPWEWQLHEAESSDPEALWEEVASTPDKPRAGWAPTLLAAMTRSRTAGELHLEDRRAAGGA